MKIIRAILVGFILVFPFIYTSAVLLNGSLNGKLEIGTGEVTIRTVVIPDPNNKFKNSDGFSEAFRNYSKPGEKYVGIGGDVIISESGRETNAILITFNAPSSISIKSAEIIEIDKSKIEMTQMPISLINRKICLNLEKATHLGSSGSYVVYFRDTLNKKLDKYTNCLPLDDKISSALKSESPMLHADPEIPNNLNSFNQIDGKNGYEIYSNVKVTLTTEFQNKNVYIWIYLLVCAFVWGIIASLIEILSFIDGNLFDFLMPKK